MSHVLKIQIGKCRKKIGRLEASIRQKDVLIQDLKDLLRRYEGD